MKVTPNKLNKFLMFKLPSAFLCGVRLKELTNEKAIVTVRHRWINQNPFKSMYFAVQSMAAELSTGAMVISKIQGSGKKVSMLVTNHEGEFTKKAVGRIRFVCEGGKLIDKALSDAFLSGEGQKIVMKSIGYDEENDIVSIYKFEWSVKEKSKKM